MWLAGWLADIAGLSSHSLFGIWSCTKTSTMVEDIIEHTAPTVASAEK